MLPAAVALVAAAVAVALVDREPARPAAPAADPIHAPALAPTLPAIADLAHYRGRDDDPWRDLNPFVPWQLRAPELATGGVTPEPEPEPIAIIDDPVDERQPPPSDGEPTTAGDSALPPLLAPADDGLHLVGLLRGAGTQLVRVRLGATTATLRPGQAIAEWRYRGLADGFARFTAPDGSEQALAIAGP